MNAKEEKVFVEAGKLFCFSEGEYSDYGYVGHFLALVPITQSLFDKVKETCRERMMREGVSFLGGEPTPFDEAEDFAINQGLRNLFLPELVRTGSIMDIDCTEIHLGSYGELDV